ncbi:TMEM175 family protein [Streptomyces smyrnaeus]|uniref:TMEM175 family protein n=1 Tax=Streptomyces smyrnaeus TaxID=1387713 RepID=UPI0037B84875
MNQVAGPGDAAQRLLTLSDGVFAIALTLLVLDISVPEDLDARQYGEALRETTTQLWSYFLSFVIIAAFWREHQNIFSTVRRVGSTEIHLTLLGLALVALLPFPTSLLSDYSEHSTTVALYSANVAATEAVLMLLWHVVWSREEVRRQPGRTAVRRASVMDAAPLVVVFAAAVPVAFLSPAVAMWLWACLIPLKMATGRRAHRAWRELRRDPDGEPDQRDGGARHERRG